MENTQGIEHPLLENGGFIKTDQDHSVVLIKRVEDVEKDSKHIKGSETTDIDKNNENLQTCETPSNNDRTTATSTHTGVLFKPNSLLSSAK